MNQFPNQTGSFNYLLEINPKTGIYNWDFSLGYQIGHPSAFDNPILSENINGDFNKSHSVSRYNQYLSIGDPDIGIVDIYENTFYSTGGENTFKKINQLTGANGFGQRLDLNNGNLFVSNPTLNNSGACYVYQDYLLNGIGNTGSANWGRKTFAVGNQQNSFFGCSHDSIIRDTEYITAIGASGQNQGTGAVFLYQQTLSTFLQEISPQNNQASLFGRSVFFTSIDDIKYLGIAYEQEGTGKIEMYKESLPNLNDFYYYQTLLSQNPSSGDLFGYSIATSNNYLIIGAPGENNSGAAYYYKFNTDSGFFENNQRIIPDDLTAEDDFGKNVSFDGDDGIISSNNAAGKIYVYHRNDNTWEEVHQILGTANIDGSFGGNISGSHNISIEGDLIIGGYSEENYASIFTTGEENLESGINFSISGSNGKLYDNDGNFIFGYHPNQKFSISGNVLSEYSNIFINNNLYNSHVSKDTGNINAWTANGLNNLNMYSLSIYNTLS